MRTWAILAPEYPPKIGGVARYVQQLATALAIAGDEVHVWAPELSGSEAPMTAGDPARVHLHALRLPLGPVVLHQLGKDIDALGTEVDLFVQYVPSGFGRIAGDFALATWLQRRRERVWIMFHEVVYPFIKGQPLSHTLLAGTTRLTASLLLRRADVAAVSTDAWRPLLERLGPPRREPLTLPIPSTLDLGVEVKARVTGTDGMVLGHFGTYGVLVTDTLRVVLPLLMARAPETKALLIGNGGDVFARELEARHPRLRGRITAPGQQSPDDLQESLGQVTVGIFPFLDGVTTRRTSIATALAMGLPTVTTDGFLTEPFWRESGCTVLCPTDVSISMVEAAESVLTNSALQRSLSSHALNAYRSHFAIEHTVSCLAQH